MLTIATLNLPAAAAASDAPARAKTAYKMASVEDAEDEALEPQVRACLYRT